MQVTSRLPGHVEVRESTNNLAGVFELLLTDKFKVPLPTDGDLVALEWYLADTFSDFVPEHLGQVKSNRQVCYKFDPDTFTAGADAINVYIADSTAFFASVRRAAVGAGDPGEASPLVLIIPTITTSVTDAGSIPIVLKGTAGNATWVRCPLPRQTSMVEIKNTGGVNALRVAYTEPLSDKFSSYETVATSGSISNSSSPKQIWLYGVAGTTTVEVVATL